MKRASWRGVTVVCACSSRAFAHEKPFPPVFSFQRPLNPLPTSAHQVTFFFLTHYMSCVNASINQSPTPFRKRTSETAPTLVLSTTFWGPVLLSLLVSREPPPPPARPLRPARDTRRELGLSAGCAPRGPWSQHPRRRRPVGPTTPRRKAKRKKPPFVARRSHTRVPRVLTQPLLDAPHALRAPPGRRRSTIQNLPRVRFAHPLSPGTFQKPCMSLQY